MTALVITHCEAEGPGHLARWLPEAGLELHVVEPWRGDELPATLEGHQALVVMGGPQQAYDDTSAPWLGAVKGLLRDAVAQRVPTLGVCLGAQLLAQACGGTVAPGEDGPELGVRLVGKRDAASGDPLFWDLPLSPLVIQWHWDAVTALPPEATLLMAGTRYPHQAFRVGDLAWGVQFHVEWSARDVTPLVEQDTAGFDGPELLAGMLEHLEEIEEVWGEVLRRFARLAT